ncbi:LysR family transcriptional regulator [Providencia sp. PROV064]|uniref:LysR family transcriptional regulator n=1 Tax=Providencia sp. PROV064 TaxID=2949790 RepID=UPI00234A359C|nr:LysR family transcriptional regulator [Providencia sp. PROV064]
MRMSIKQLRAFSAVAHTLSFAHASERLNMSQPALSLTIKGLEETLGGPLLLRTTRKVMLTPEGETLLKMSRQLLSDWDSTEEAMRQHFNLQCGKVSIAAMPSFATNVLPPILKTFRMRYPGINITVHDVINEQVIEMVHEGRVEIGIVFEPNCSEQVNFTPLGLERFIAIVPPDCHLANRERISWRELLSLDFITLQRPSSVRFMLEEELKKNGRSLKVAFESHQLVTVGQLVANGLGGSAVSALCRTQMKELGAVCLELDNPVIERRVGLLYSAHNQFSTAAQALVNTLKKAYNP